jgi:hypothetical protein
MTLLALILALQAQEEIRLLVRSDDMGAAQAVNEGCVKSVVDGIARSVEIIVPAPGTPRPSACSKIVPRSTSASTSA